MTTVTDNQPSFPHRDASKLPKQERVPPPKYRHAAPSAPWPWMDFNKDDAIIVPPSAVPHEPWSRYPQSHFENWTSDQVERCRMLKISEDQNICRIHKVDVFRDGQFDRPTEEGARPRQVPSDPTSAREFWEELQKPLDPNLRVRAIFVESITLNVLQILGASYNVEPFFFASSANWIPSRYQEDPHAEGDHITVVLPFIRTISREDAGPVVPLNGTQDKLGKESEEMPETKHVIDTQVPLVLSDRKILLQDLLAIHMVRSTKDNVIISYHHHSELQKTRAEHLRSLVQRTGDSVYWSKLYDRSKDPTLIFLAILWYALYAWDEALEVLYAHLSEQLEATDVTTDLKHTRELHKLQAHLLYYQQLLRDFRKSVEFVRDTPNPAMDKDPDRERSMKILKLEAENMLSEIQRLERQRQIQSDRLKNMMDLSFSTVNIVDNISMRELTKTTMRDSSAMKRISYLTLVFLPSNFIASVFGMNVREMFNAAFFTPTSPPPPATLATYIESTIILMAITAWFVVALQDPSAFHPGGRCIVRRIAWPVFYGYELMKRMVTRDATQPATDTVGQGAN